MIGFMDEDEMRDSVQRWCEANGQYELGQRVAFVPGDVLKKLIGKKPEEAAKILEAEGY